MIKRPGLRVAVASDAVSIWSSEIFGEAEPARLREFLARAFAVTEVQRIDLRPEKSYGCIHYRAKSDPAHIWRKLSRALTSEPTPSAVNALATGEATRNGATANGDSALEHPVQRRLDAEILYLDHAGTSKLRVSRVGEVLSTWRVREHSANTLLLSHPRLRNRRDVVFRLEEELTAIVGVQDFRVSALTSHVSIRFDRKQTSAERVTSELERAWPRLLSGLDGPPSRARLGVAAGLTGLAYVGQYLVPGLRPLAVAGVALYSSPNVIKAVKQLTRGQVGLYALYSTGLGFMLASGMPFNAALIATFMQFWPHLAHQKLVSSQRRIFAEERRRPAWAKLRNSPDTEIEVNVEDLQQGDVIVVHAGDWVPVDASVKEGAAAVVEEAPFGGKQHEQKSAGDQVAAGAYVSAGTLTLQVELSAAESFTRRVHALLPRASVLGLPSTQEAERIANRNAKPALALAALSLFLTRTALPAQAVLRPDYATAPRLSVQLSALHALAAARTQGIWLNNAAVLDRISAATTYVLDDTAGLDRQALQVVKIDAVKGTSPDLVLAYALGALLGARTEQSEALAEMANSRKLASPTVKGLSRDAGVTRFTDEYGGQLEVATSKHVKANGIEVPKAFARVLTRRHKRPHGDATAASGDQPSLRPLWVLRDTQVIGVVTFARSGELAGKALVRALRARHEAIQIVHVSTSPQSQADALGSALSIEARGDMSAEAKADFIRGLVRPVVWVGDGSAPEARDALAASTVSISVAPAARLGADAADVLLPHRGLSALPHLVDIGRAHAARLARDYRTVYALNLLGVAGAFVAGFGSLPVGLLSNLGTGLVYARRARELDLVAANGV